MPSATRPLYREPQPRRFGKPLSIRLGDGQLDRLDELSHLVERSRNSLIREAIDLFLHARDETQA